MIRRQRSFWRRIGRRLSPWGKMLGGALLGGLGTYGAIRGGSYLLRPLARSNFATKHLPSFVSTVHNLPGTATEWALGSALVDTAFGTKNLLSKRRKKRSTPHSVPFKFRRRIKIG